MSTIITREGKGSELEWTELDANFTNLNADKVEITAVNDAVLVETTARIAADALLAHKSTTYTKTEVDAALSGKASAANNTGVNTGDQTIPTTLPASDVYPWAKAATKPSYTASEVGAPSGSGTSSGTNTGDQTLSGLGGLAASDLGSLTVPIKVTDTLTAGSTSLAGSAVDIAQTWATTGNPTAIKLNVTNSNSGATAKLLDLQVGGSSKFSVDKTGIVRTRWLNSLTDNGYIGFTNAQLYGNTWGINYQLNAFNASKFILSLSSIDNIDVVITADAANTLAQRNGVNSQTSRIYNTYTTASDYERIALTFAPASSSVFTATIATTVMTVTETPTAAITVGQGVFGVGVTAGTTISSLGTGTGGAGTYNLSISQTVSTATQMTSRYGTALYAQVTAESGGTGAANIGIALSPKGTGAITAQVPDGTTAGGNARGANSVDLQTLRNTNTQVASGIGSVILGGNGNASTIDYATVLGGQYNTVSSYYSSTIGGYNNKVSGQFSTATGAYGVADKRNQIVVGLLQFTTPGDMQYSSLGFAGATTNATITEIFLGNAANARATIPNNTTWAADIDIVARSSGGTENAYFKRRLLIQKGTTAASTALVGSVELVSTIVSTGASTWAVTLSADTTNGSLKLEVTGIAATNIRWVAKVSLVEVGFA